MTLREKYGEWGLVCGGSVGQGGAHANKLAEGGMNVAVVGRHQETVDGKCRQLEADYGVKTKGVVVDLGALDAPEQIFDAMAGLEVGALVYNAGYANVVRIDEAGMNNELYRLNINCRSLLACVLHFVKPMKERDRGLVIITSSDAALIGAPYVGPYSATRGYALNLGEALWGEMYDFNVDVIVVMPGNTIGQNYSDVPPGTPGFQTGAEVVEEAYAHLGHYPSWISGEVNRENLAPVYNPDTRREMVLKYKQIMEENTDFFGAGIVEKQG